MHRVIPYYRFETRSYRVQDEENLVRRAKERDQEAFAQLYEEYFDKIYRYVALKIGDRMEAEDIMEHGAAAAACANDENWTRCAQRSTPFLSRSYDW